MSWRLRVSLLVWCVMASAVVWPSAAAARPVSGPRESVDNRLSTSQLNASAGFHYVGSYHAVGDASGDPPYMRKMESFSPPGLRYDTGVPARCAASDPELAVRGASACPAGSRVGGGTIRSTLLGFPSTLHADVLNNTDEQIILVSSPEVSSITRGHIHRDGSITFAAPTCFPSTQLAACPVDDALQLGSNITVAPMTKTSAGTVRRYLTTPPSCPASGHWEMPFRFWWADGAVDTVLTKQPCRHSQGKPRSHRRRHSRRHRPHPGASKQNYARIGGP
jgi:hypothetical protein